MSIDPLIQELETKRKALHISRSLCAKLLKIPAVSFYRWTVGTHAPTVYYRREVQKLLKFIKEIEKNTDGGKV